MNQNYSNNIEKANNQAQKNNCHKYMFSKNNILNHETSLESVETKLATNTKENNTRNYLTNSNNNSILTKLRNKIKEKQELSYMIVESKKYKKKINNNNKKANKSLEKNKKTLKTKKREGFVNSKYSDIISPLNKRNIFKFDKNNSHKRINSTFLNNGEKRPKYNNSFRETEKQIKLNNKSLELSIDNYTNNNEIDNYNKTISLTSNNLNNIDNNKNNIDNSEYILSEQKNDIYEDENINNEEIINMSKKKQKLIEEINLKKQELKKTELSLEILRNKYKKKLNEQTNPSSINHTNNKIISNYGLNISISKNNNSRKNTTIYNDSFSLSRKSFFAKTSLYKNRKRISPSYNRELIDLKHSLVNDRFSHSFRFRNNISNHININFKSKNYTLKNKSKNKEISPFDKRVFSLQKKNEKNINKENDKNKIIIIKKNLKNNYISPEKKTDKSIETGNYATHKTNDNMNKNKLRLNNSNYILRNRQKFDKKKAIIKKEINVKHRSININLKKKSKNFFKDNKHKNIKDNIIKNKLIRDQKENSKNEKNVYKNFNEQSNNFISNDNIKLNESDKENKSIQSINDSNNKNEKNKIINISNVTNFNLEIKSISLLESICKRGFAGPDIKKTNQDNFFIYNNFNNNPNYIYLGICDGHGMFGQGVSTFLVNNLPQNLNSFLLSQNIKNVSNADITLLSKNIVSTFLSTNEQLIQDERIDSAFSGSTCVSLIYTPSRLICINVGDSRCILGKFDGEKWKSYYLSRDHKPNIIDEKERIIKSGGKIEAYKDNNGNFVGPDRVWLQGGELPGLAMSRSFGDEVAHLVGVITEPEIVEYYFNKEDKFIILGSDGLWEFINSEECVEIVKDFYLENNVEGALTYLYKEASKRWILEEEIIDDITIIIIFLKE